MFDKLQEKLPFRLIPALIALGVFFAVLLCPIPEGITPKAWTLLALFAAVILAIILKVMPIGAMSLIAIVAVSLLQVTSDSSKDAVRVAIDSFNNPLIWLIAISIIISKSLKKTGFGNRIAYMAMRVLGKRTLGIGYGLALCELVLAPLTPSNTARGGGIIHPVMRSIAHALGSDPEKGTQGKIGTYLALVNYHSNPITSAMFITATAPNPLVVNYIAQATGGSFHLSWGTWALAMLLPGLIAMLLMPLVIYMLTPPEIKTTPRAVEMANAELKKLGAFSAHEKLLAGLFVVMLVFWAGLPTLLASWGGFPVLAGYLKIDPTGVALAGLAFLLLSGILTWDDVIGEKSAWDTLFWFAALIMLADQLNKLGVMGVFSNWMAGVISSSGMHWMGAAAVLIGVFFYTHYVFASTTAHMSAMLLAFLTVGVTVIPGEYIPVFMLMMAASGSLMMTLTHYATGTSPIIFSSGFVSMAKWWQVGFVMSVVNLALFALVGAVWWKLLGFW